MDATPTRPSGLLISRDLIFTSKVTSTARALGFQVLVAGNSALILSMIEEWKPRAVFVDLAAGELVSVPALVAYRHAAEESTPFIAFGSHVDTQALDAAKSAGCALVLPRSKFSTDLPDLIQKYLGPTEPIDA
jgi:DNA-binding response OmpR family regulator